MKAGWDYPEAILLSGVISLPFKGPPELVLLVVCRGGSGPQTLKTEVFSCIHTLSRWRHLFVCSVITSSRKKYSLRIIPASLHLKGTDPFFLPILIIIIIFFFFGWKSILRYLGNVSQNIRGLRVPEPPQMGANIYIYIYIYIIVCITL